MPLSPSAALSLLRAYVLDSLRPAWREGVEDAAAPVSPADGDLYAAASWIFAAGSPVLSADGEDSGGRTASGLYVFEVPYAGSGSFEVGVSPEEAERNAADLSAEAAAERKAAEEAEEAGERACREVAASAARSAADALSALRAFYPPADVLDLLVREAVSAALSAGLSPAEAAAVLDVSAAETRGLVGG